MLYIVSTPIGNLADITYRAIEVLQSVDLILCEDTRRSSILLARYNIKKPLKKYEKFSERSSLDDIVGLLREGKNLALVSDAGTPIISDPGSPLVTRLKEEGLEYTAAGGQCAAINALVLSGFDATSFCFVGFLPEKNADRVSLIERFAELTATLVFYISPHAATRDIAFLGEHLGARSACLVREISKVYEQCIDFTLPNIPDNAVLRGEIVLVVGGASKAALRFDDIREHYAHYLTQGLEEKEAMKRVARERGVSKSEVYAAVKIIKTTD